MRSTPRGLWPRAKRWSSSTSWSCCLVRIPRRTAIWPKRPSARFWDCSFLLSSAMINHQPRDGLRVADLLRADELERLVEAHAHGLQDLVDVALGAGGGEAFRDVHVHQLGAEAGGRV